MAMVKCPECDKEISENAVNCPGCGYPLKEMKKEEEKKKKQTIECPECHNMVDASTDICPNCGKPLKNGAQKINEKAKLFFSKKGSKFILGGIGAAIVILFIFFRIFQSTIFDEYTKYLGEKANELPNSFVHEEVFDDEYEARPENGVTIFDIGGEMGYDYSKADDVEKDRKNIINAIGWHSDESEYSKSELQDFLKKLEKEYGAYDKKEVEEMDWIDDTYDYPRRITYVWENKNGIHISLFANEDYEEDDEWEYEDEDEITTYNTFHIWWTMSDDE